MINLLDANAKRDLRAARTNVILATYCAVIGATVICVVLLVLFSNWWLNNKIAVASAQQSANEASTSSYNAVRVQASQFTTNLGKIQSVLKSRSQYSTALLNIAGSLPAGAYINQATLSPTFVTTPLKITATTSSNSTALALKQKLSTSKLYSKVTLDSVNCGGDNGTGCIVSLTATLNQATIFAPGATQ